jgi:putative membrane protein
MNSRRTLKEYLVLLAKGFSMGAADVVPGVSGGTMAFILGIYEELLESIRVFLSPSALMLVIKLKWREAYQTLPWPFLFVLFAGIMTAIFTLAQFLEWMLDNYPELLWAFFFGLVAASIFTVIKRVKNWNTLAIAMVIVGAVAAWVIVGLVPTAMSHGPLFLFFSGFIAICAMILPGISGSFILVLLGQYEYILSAVNNRDVVTLVIVAAGALVGLGSFARVLSWLFKRYHDITVAVLIGFMAGSLRKIWPWKENLSYMTDRHGELVPLEQINVLPAGVTPEVMLAIALAIVGFALVWVIEHVSSRKEVVEQAYA